MKVSVGWETLRLSADKVAGRYPSALFQQLSAAGKGLWLPTDEEGPKHSPLREPADKARRGKGGEKDKASAGHAMLHTEVRNTPHVPGPNLHTPRKCSLLQPAARTWIAPSRGSAARAPLYAREQCQSCPSFPAYQYRGHKAQLLAANAPAARAATMTTSRTR